MPYKVSWLVDQRVMYTRMYGFVTGEELGAQKVEMEALLPKDGPKLYIITDGTDTTGTNMGLRDLQKTQFADATNLGWAVYISPKKMDRFFASVITQLLKKRSREFATLEEGIRFLQSIDETLPSIPLPDKTA
ncbi:MAG: hypothetical protein ABI970_01505 [Chloroflexota bacterium]|nr:hypothetical protein [Anaerolineae bacterium]